MKRSGRPSLFLCPDIMIESHHKFPTIDANDMRYDLHVLEQYNVRERDAGSQPLVIPSSFINLRVVR